PMPVLLARKDRNRVYWSVVGGEPVLKSQADHPDCVRCWDRVLEAIDLLAAHDNEDDLLDAYGRALTLLDGLALSERWDLDDNYLKEELDRAYVQRLEQLSDQPTDFQQARVTEAVRRMRGCETLADLEDVAGWVQCHAGDFTPESLGTLRRWYG